MAATINTGVSRTAIEDKLKKFDDIITVSKTGHGDFVCSDYTSDVLCIQAALDYIASNGGGELYIMTGVYVCGDGITYTNNNLIISGQGDNTVLDFRTAPSPSFSSLIRILGEVTTTNSLLTVNANAAELNITVADGSKFVAGDWIRIRSEAIFHPRTGAVWNEKLGEYQQIESVAGNVITLKEKLFGSYLTSDTATVDLAVMRKNITLRDFKMIGQLNTDQNGIYIRQATDINIDRINFEDVFVTAVYLYDVVGASVTNTTVHRAYRTERGYGLAVSNASRDVTASGNHYFNCRHAITCNGDQGYGIQYNQSYFGNTFSYDSRDQVMFGMHPSYSGLTVSGNTVSSGGLGFFNGSNTTVVGNTCMNSEVWAISLPDGAENVLINGNIIHSKTAHCIAVRTQYSNIAISNNFFTNDAADSDGISIAEQIQNVIIEGNYIKTIGNGINVVTYNAITNSSDVKICGNKIITTGSNPGIKLELYSDAYTISKTTIENNTITATSSGACILLSRYSGTGTFQQVDIKNNVCYGGADTIDINTANRIDIIGNHIYDATRGLIIHDTVTNYNVDRNHFDGCATAIVRNATESGNRVTDNIGYNPIGVITAPNVPPSGTLQTNIHTYPCRIAVSGGTVSNIAISGTATGLTSGVFILQPAETITLTYTVAPVWVWLGL